MRQNTLHCTLRYSQYDPDMLTTGLDILRILAEADGPLTATAIAERVDLHVSNVSRTLAVLAKHGYVRKPTYHSFAPDLGVLTLAGLAVSRLPAVARTKEILVGLAKESGMLASLATLHQGQVIYLHRCDPHGETISAVAGGWPLHLSVVGLRLLLDLPVKQAQSALELAAKRYGWPRPTPATPPDPKTCLAEAKRRFRNRLLRIDGWDQPGNYAAAIRISVPNHAPLALAFVGTCTCDPEPLFTSATQSITTVLQEKNP
jgi:DNA-binding IclR family transcriptional regulator